MPQIEQARDTLHKRQEALTNAYNELLIVDEAHRAGSDGWDEHIKLVIERLAEAQERLIRCLDHIEQAAPTRGGAAGTTAGGGTSSRVMDTLKPETLTAEYTPTQLKNWIDCLTDWFEASDLNNKPAAPQFAWNRDFIQ